MSDVDKLKAEKEAKLSELENADRRCDKDIKRNEKERNHAQGAYKISTDGKEQGYDTYEKQIQKEKNIKKIIKAKKQSVEQEYGKKIKEAEEREKQRKASQNR